MAFKLIVAILTVSIFFDGNVVVKAGHAHSFQHFHGPVVGDAQAVTWKDKHGHEHQDYVAQPHYEFSYGVEDHHSGDYHGQKEQRDDTRRLGVTRGRRGRQFWQPNNQGKDVVGEYTIKEPGGNIRTVKYRAGKDGFFAQVVNNKGNAHEEEDQ